MANVAGDMDAEHADLLGRRYLIRFEEDTLRQRPLRIRLIIEFLGTSLVMETALTAILVSIILNTATGHRSIGHNAAIAVGSTVALLGLFASPSSGASMNPARSLGPNIVSTHFTGWWVYIAGPVIGAAIAFIIITLVRAMPNREKRDAAQGSALPILGSDGQRPSEQAQGPAGG